MTGSVCSPRARRRHLCDCGKADSWLGARRHCSHGRPLRLSPPCCPYLNCTRRLRWPLCPLRHVIDGNRWSARSLDTHHSRRSLCRLLKSSRTKRTQRLTRLPSCSYGRAERKKTSSRPPLLPGGMREWLPCVARRCSQEGATVTMRSRTPRIPSSMHSRGEEETSRLCGKDRRS